jgi:hypothetical protein
VFLDTLSTTDAPRDSADLHFGAKGLGFRSFDDLLIQSCTGRIRKRAWIADACNLIR